MEELEREYLAELICRCIEGDLIEDCLREEQGQYSVTVGEMTNWLSSDQARRLLERLLQGGQVYGSEL